jgi:5-hydroxyisourate hydrolase-like protein (transthyretin family)
MTKIPLTEKSVIEIHVKVKLTVDDLNRANKVCYDTEEEHLVDSSGRIWAPLVMLENIGAGDYKTLTSVADFEESLGLTVEEYTEIETYITE